MLKYNAEGLLSLKMHQHLRVAAEFSVLTSPCNSHFQPMGTNEMFFHKFPLCVEITHFN